MGNPMRDISQAELQSAFHYNEETGEFRWRIDPPGNRRKTGDLAGSWTVREKKRRLVLCLKGRRIYGHRAAYIYTHGDLPQNALLDHIDGNSENNRISNLRLVNPAQNTWNKLVKGKAPGVDKGPRGRWKARIQGHDGRKINLGTWDSEAEARAAYLGAAAILHGDYAPIDRVAKNAAAGFREPQRTS